MPSFSSRFLRALLAVTGALLVCASLVIIWVSRVVIARSVYVSGLGADGEPTAKWFEVALLLLVAGGFAIAWSARHLRSRIAVLARWTPALSIAVASALFLVASQVPCTLGCPLPAGPTFTWQDLVHTTAAVLAFAAAAVAMLQVSFIESRPALARLSMISAVLVAVIAAAGGIMSILRFRVDIGSIFEFVATTVGIGWLALLGFMIAASPPMASSALLPADSRRVASNHRDDAGEEVRVPA